MTRIKRKFPSAVYPTHLKDDTIQTRRLEALDLVKTINEQSKSRLYKQMDLGTKFGAVGGVSLQPHLLDGEPPNEESFIFAPKDVPGHVRAAAVVSCADT